MPRGSNKNTVKLTDEAAIFLALGLNMSKNKTPTEQCSKCRNTYWVSDDEGWWKCAICSNTGHFIGTRWEDMWGVRHGIYRD